MLIIFLDYCNFTRVKAEIFMFQMFIELSVYKNSYLISLKPEVCWRLGSEPQTTVAFESLSKAFCITRYLNHLQNI